ncbi:Hypothetical predicted protein [Paramuricea clavata]|uniref:Uncharacterized protein n=1 Tax=Paramuricea clavata TaxID=317549 RepID=A0A6S7JNX4_PARCT|nr:Hypothetical predicted protein [Paramuricea clavata]
MQPPRNVSEVKSLLGMTQYVSRFIPNYASITTPLRTLTHQNAKWQWQAEQENALKKLQHELTNDPVMAYFDPSKPTTVIVDASPPGLGALLTQEGRVISYASRALSSVESRYSQTEREILAVIWAIEHYHLYLYGAKFAIITDHKPLLGIFKSQKPTSARIDRWNLRLMPYDCEVVYNQEKMQKTLPTLSTSQAIDLAYIRWWNRKSRRACHAKQQLQASCYSLSSTNLADSPNLVPPTKKNKLTPPFNFKPFTVETRKGTMIDNRVTDTSDDENDDDDFECDRTNEDQHNQEPAYLRRSQRERRQPNRLGFEH